VRYDPLSTASGPELFPRAGDADAIIHVPASASFYEAAIEGLTLLDEQILSSSPDFPRLYESGVVYRKEAKDTWRHADDVLCSGWGDCEDLASWRVAELRVSGEDPDSYVYVYQSGPHRYHAVVARGDGRIEDPSLILGMQVSPERRKKLPKFVGQGEGRFPSTTRQFGACPRALELSGAGEDRLQSCAGRETVGDGAGGWWDDLTSVVRKVVDPDAAAATAAAYAAFQPTADQLRAAGNSRDQAFVLFGPGQRVDRARAVYGASPANWPAWAMSGEEGVGFGWGSFNPMRAVRAAESAASRLNPMRVLPFGGVVRSAMSAPFGALRAAESAAGRLNPLNFLQHNNPQSEPPTIPDDSTATPEDATMGNERGDRMCSANRNHGETIGDASSPMLAPAAVGQHRCSMNCPHFAADWRRAVQSAIQGDVGDPTNPDDSDYDPSQDPNYDPTQDPNSSQYQDPNALPQQGGGGPSTGQKVGRAFGAAANAVYQPIKWGAQIAYQPIRLASKILSTGATVAKGATNLAMLPLKGVSKLFSLFGEEDFRGLPRPSPALLRVEEDEDYEDGDEEVITREDLFSSPHFEEAEDEDFLDIAELAPMSQRMRFTTAEVAPGIWGGRVMIPRADEPGRAFTMYTSPSRSEREAAERMRNLAIQAAENPGLQLAVSPAALITMAAIKAGDMASGSGKVASVLRNVGKFIRIEG
jgi:hypothetical protein